MHILHIAKVAGQYGPDKLRRVIAQDCESVSGFFWAFNAAMVAKVDTMMVGACYTLRLLNAQVSTSSFEVAPPPLLSRIPVP
jgi:hypothetical protein